MIELLLGLALVFAAYVAVWALVTSWSDPYWTPRKERKARHRRSTDT